MPQSLLRQVTMGRVVPSCLALLALVIAGCGGESSNDSSGSMPIVANPASDCEPVGSSGEAADGCNTCTCTEDGWSCTELACSSGCTDGQTRAAADGCNTCSCTEGQWTCAARACADSPDGTTNGLLGEYVLVSSDGYEPVEGTSVRISIGEEGFGFSAGCNSHGGDYELHGDVLVLGGLSSTEIGCESALMSQDYWLAEFFSGSPRFELDGNTLRFFGSGASLTFLDREVAEPDAALIGTTWTIDTLVDGQAAMAGFGLSASVEFGGDATFELQGPCNDAKGAFEHSDDEIVFGSVAFTEVGCAKDEARDFEAHLQRVFTQGEATYEIEANRLRLDHGSAGILARAE